MSYIDERQLLKYLYTKPKAPAYISEKEKIEGLEEEIRKTQVIILAGGTGKRMGNPNLPKALQVVGEKTLIDRYMEVCAKCGLTNIILLIGFLHEEIMKHVGDGSRYGVSVRYCVDPPIKKVGKGKALKNAIQQKVIDLNKTSIIGYPDDILLDENIPLKLLGYHLRLREKGVLATVVCVEGIEYPYGVALSYDGEIVEKFFEKPIVRIPSSIGLCVIEPPVYEIIKEKVNMDDEEAVEFESVVLPYLAEKGKLGRFTIGVGEWIPVNTQKDVEIAEKILRERK